MTNRSNDRLLNILEEAGEDGLTVRELLHHLGEDAPSATTLRRRLRALSRDGVVSRLDRHRWGFSDLGSRDDWATLVFRSGGKPNAEMEATGEVFPVDLKSVGNAIAGDRIRVDPERARGGHLLVQEYESCVPRIVRGEVRREGKYLVVHSEMIGEPGLITRSTASDAEMGEVASYRVVGRADRSYRVPGLPAYPILLEPLAADSESRIEPPKARAAFALVEPGERDATRLLDQLSRSLGVDAPFSQEAMRQAEAITDPESVDPAGMDLTDTALVTIDGPTAKDFDDAVFAERVGPDIRLLVTVADVGRYVPEDSVLDMEARERGSSVYLPGRVYPMLPKTLSDGVCSLVPHRLRHCAWVSLLVDKAGDIVDADAGFGTMRSHARLTYAEVQQFLDNEADAPSEAIADSLRTLEAVRLRLHRKRKKRGMLDLDLAEQEIELTEDGSHVKAVEPAPRLNAHRLIEEAMLAANETIANLLAAEGWPQVRRVHADPPVDRVERVSRIAAAIGLDIPPKGVPTIDELNDALATVQGKPQSRALSFLLLRSLAPATYSVEDAGHFGIGAPRYLHFTSPIRRYPDLENHRLLRRMLSERAPRGEERATLIGRLEHSAEHANRGEKLSVRAERYADRLLTAIFMEERVGQVFDSVIMDVVPFGLFVNLGRPNIDGLIPIRTLGRERWEFDEEELRLVGTRSGITWRIGQQVRVRCESVNVSEGQVEFAALDTPSERSTPVTGGSAQRPGGKRDAKSASRRAKGGTKPRSARKSRKDGGRDSGGAPAPRKKRQSRNKRR